MSPVHAGEPPWLWRAPVQACPPDNVCARSVVHLNSPTPNAPGHPPSLTAPTHHPPPTHPQLASKDAKEATHREMEALALLEKATEVGVGGAGGAAGEQGRRSTSVRRRRAGFVLPPLPPGARPPCCPPSAPPSPGQAPSANPTLSNLCLPPCLLPPWLFRRLRPCMSSCVTATRRHQHQPTPQRTRSPRRWQPPAATRCGAAAGAACRGRLQPYCLAWRAALLLENSNAQAHPHSALPCSDTPCTGQPGCAGGCPGRVGSGEAGGAVGRAPAADGAGEAAACPLCGPCRVVVTSKQCGGDVGEAGRNGERVSGEDVWEAGGG